MLQLDLHRSDPFVSDPVLQDLQGRTREAHASLVSGMGAGAEWRGWRRILADPNDALLEQLTATADRIRSRADVLLCIGIGGSYLGADAVIRALSPYFPKPETTQADAPVAGTGSSAQIEIVFAGHHLSGAYLEQLLAHLEGKSVVVNVISKSGTTLEPGVTFRVVRDWMQRHFEDADERIMATTDARKGALRQLADERGWKTFVIPDDVGGRFSVLTPVGLLPIAVAGYDIRRLFYGAVAMMKDIDANPAHPAYAYAARRYALHQSGFVTEVLSVFEPKLDALGAWWAQLFGESEGKQGKGLFPTRCVFSTDLHSLGQYLQDGQRNVCETFLVLEDDRGRLRVPAAATDTDGSGPDGLSFVAGKTFSELTRAALEGTMDAHQAGGVPVQTIRIARLDEDTLGGLIYFFEHVVALGGYLLEINPFDQPGVEAYKKAMYQRLGRQG